MSNQEEYLRKIRDYTNRRQHEEMQYEQQRARENLAVKIQEVAEESVDWESFTELEQRVNKIEAFLRKKYLEEWDSFEEANK